MKMRAQQATIDAKTVIVDDLHETQTSLQDEVKALQSTVDRERHSLNSLQDQYRETVRDLAEERSQVSTLQKTLHETKQRVQSQDTSLEEYSRKCASLTKSIDGARRLSVERRTYHGAAGVSDAANMASRARE